jgi:putative hydrolase of the HAD superfamily
MGQILYEQEFQPESVVVYQDVPETLERLRSQGLRLGIVSDHGLDIRKHLAHHGLLGHFGTCVLSYEHGTVKPDPRLFHAACDELGAHPGATLMVGDNPHTDGGAIDAGLTALILPPVQRGAVRGLDACIALVSQ